MACFLSIFLLASSFILILPSETLKLAKTKQSKDKFSPKYTISRGKRKANQNEKEQLYLKHLQTEDVQTKKAFQG